MSRRVGVVAFGTIEYAPLSFFSFYPRSYEWAIDGRTRDDLNDLT